MGREYTPETWVVRDRYAHGVSDLTLTTFDEGQSEFDRWLTGREAQVEERTLRDLIAAAGGDESVPVRLIRARDERLHAAQFIYRGES